MVTDAVRPCDLGKCTFIEGLNVSEESMATFMVRCNAATENLLKTTMDIELAIDDCPYAAGVAYVKEKTEGDVL